MNFVLSYLMLGRNPDRVFRISRGKGKMWGCFAGEPAKRPRIPGLPRKVQKSQNLFMIIVRTLLESLGGRFFAYLMGPSIGIIHGL